MQRKRGFTLMELLVVIAIIGILAGLSFTALSRAKAKGYEAACVNRLKQWGVAFSMYSDEFNGVLLDLDHWQSVHFDWGSGPVTNPYVKYFGGGDPASRIHAMRLCPAVSAKLSAAEIVQTKQYSYSANHPYTQINGIYQLLPSTNGRWVSLKKTPKPDQFLLMIDSDGTAYTFTQSTLLNRVRTIQDRHSGEMNALFADFHVERLAYQAILGKSAIPIDQNPWFQMD
jgi:prepilin-type N-terminal cleavage/methylation domain-containing protein/prepilin-type processing-associated H-X9-DG protein